eukprot:750733-Hanusia_phi.AAC.15
MNPHDQVLVDRDFLNPAAVRQSKEASVEEGRAVAVAAHPSCGPSCLVPSQTLRGGERGERSRSLFPRVHSADCDYSIGQEEGRVGARRYKLLTGDKRWIHSGDGDVAGQGDGDRSLEQDRQMVRGGEERGVLPDVSRDDLKISHHVHGAGCFAGNVRGIQSCASGDDAGIDRKSKVASNGDVEGSPEVEGGGWGFEGRGRETNPEEGGGERGVREVRLDRPGLHKDMRAVQEERSIVVVHVGRAVDEAEPDVSVGRLTRQAHRDSPDVRQLQHVGAVGQERDRRDLRHIHPPHLLAPQRPRSRRIRADRRHPAGVGRHVSEEEGRLVEDERLAVVEGVEDRGFVGVVAGQEHFDLSRERPQRSEKANEEELPVSSRSVPGDAQALTVEERRSKNGWRYNCDGPSSTENEICELGMSWESLTRTLLVDPQTPRRAQTTAPACRTLETPSTTSALTPARRRNARRRKRPIAILLPGAGSRACSRSGCPSTAFFPSSSPHSTQASRSLGSRSYACSQLKSSSTCPPAHPSARSQPLALPSSARPRPRSRRRYGTARLTPPAMPHARRWRSGRRCRHPSRKD